jgi:hypothetical protein
VTVIGADPAGPQSALLEPALAATIASRSEQLPLPGVASSAVVFTVIANAAGAKSTATRHVSTPAINLRTPTIPSMITEERAIRNGVAEANSGQELQQILQLLR